MKLHSRVNDISVPRCFEICSRKSWACEFVKLEGQSRHIASPETEICNPDARARLISATTHAASVDG